MRRFNVYDNARLIAVLHADTAEEAIQLACMKTDGHQLAACSVVPVLGAESAVVGTACGPRSTEPKYRPLR